jgi:aminopeptidase N
MNYQMLSLKIILIATLLPAWLFAEQTLKFTGNCSQEKCGGDGIRADNSRSDTIDIIDYDIHLDILDFTGKSIGGYTSVTFKSKLDGVSQLYLDLLKLHVDSVKQNGQPLSFSYTDSLLLIIDLAAAMNTGDASVVTVYYHGKPQVDASGWGGFYFSGDYAYNLGVGFAADPHVYGRVWFPCFDNFVERSTYHFSITTSDTKDGAVQWRINFHD